MLKIFRKIKSSKKITQIGIFVAVFLLIPQITYASWESFLSFFGLLYKFGSNPIDGLLALLAVALLGFFGFLMNFAAGLLDVTIQYTLVDLGANIEGISAIKITWGIIRDLINMSFIFILLYIAIGTILNIGVNWKSTLVKVVVAAILINFSLFFTKIVIDASNVVALTFYNSFSGVSGSSMAANFTGPLKIQTLYGDFSTAVGEGSSKQLIAAGLLGSVFLLVTIFVFLAMTLLFLSRFVTIIFLLILSPIGFFGSVLPGLSGIGKQWRDTLMGQAIFAPVYMILTWMVLQIINDPGFKAPIGSKLSQAFSIDPSTNLQPVTGFMDLFMNYVIIIIFMMATLILSKKAASQGSDLGQKLVGGATALGAAGVGATGRRSLGWAARTADKKGWLQGADTAAAGRTVGSGLIHGKGWGRLEGFKTYGARATAGAVRGTASGSMDIRKGINAAGALAGFGNAASEMGFGNQLGDAGKGGYVAREQAKEKTRRERTEASDRAQNAQTVLNGVKAAQDPAFQAAQAAVRAGIATSAQKALVDTVEQMELAIAKTSTKEVETLVDNNKQLLRSQAFANRISVQQLEALNKTDKFSDQEKGALTSARFVDVNAITGTGGSVPSARSLEQIQGLSDSELEVIDSQTLTDRDFVGTLKQNQIDAVMKSNKFTTSQKDQITDTRKDVFIRSVTANPAILKNKNTSIKQIAGLPMTPRNPGEASLSTPSIIDQLTPSLLKRIAPELDAAKSQALKSEILGIAGIGNPTLQAWLSRPENADVL